MMSFLVAETTGGVYSAIGAVVTILSLYALLIKHVTNSEKHLGKEDLVTDELCKARREVFDVQTTEINSKITHLTNINEKLYTKIDDMVEKHNEDTLTILKALNDK